MVNYKKDSIVIRQFIQENKSKVQPPKIVFSDKSRKFIDQIHKNINDAFRKSSTPFFKLVSPSAIGKDFEKSENYSYICKDVISAFASVNKYKKTIEMRIGTRVFKIRFVLPIPLVATDMRVYSEAVDIYARRIYVWLYLANTFASNECSKEIDIFLYLTNEVKVLPDLCGDAIDRIHVNTAFTTPCAPKTEINVFRCEEWFKVFIHETFHCLGLDFSNYESINNIAGAEILKQIPIDAKILLYETYSEIWAEIFNTIITVSIETHGKHISFVSLIENMLDNELFFSEFQCAKILDHFKLDYEDLYKQEPDTIFSFNGGKKTRYKEKTAVFSYFFLKTILLLNCNKFLEWSLDKNGETVMFKNPETNIRKFSDDLILSKYNDPVFVANLKQMKTLFFMRRHSGKKAFIYNTLRMTANEIV
jgi:hypothetical protein